VLARLQPPYRLFEFMPALGALETDYIGFRTGSLGAGSVGAGIGLGTTTGLGIVSGMSMGSEPG